MGELPVIVAAEQAIREGKWKKGWTKIGRE